MENEPISSGVSEILARDAAVLALMQRMMVENQKLRMEILHLKYMEPLSRDPGWGKL